MTINPIVVILATLLTVSVWFNYNHSKTIESLKSDVTELNITKTSLNDQVTALKKDIKEMPARYIETTREVDKEICLGVNAIDKVMSLHNRIEKEVSNENSDQKANYVDIDGEFPPDLVKLLNAD